MARDRSVVLIHASRMKNRQHSCLRWLLLASLHLALTLRAEAQKPNVVIIVADGFAWSDSSLHGESTIETPAINSIGNNGVRADRYLVTRPGEGSLAAMLTGRYAAGGGNRTGKARANPETGAATLGSQFEANGYRTCFLGKFPSPPTRGGEPLLSGFTRQFDPANPDSSIGDIHSTTPAERSVGRTVREGNDAILRELDAFLQAAAHDSQAAANPSFLAVIRPAASPAFVSDVEGAKSESAEQAGSQRSGGADSDSVATAETERVTAGVLGLLEKRDSSGNTFVFFTSTGARRTVENYDWLRPDPPEIDESGTRVPLFIKGPFITSGKMIVPPIADIDLLPSLKVFCGLLKSGHDALYDGRSMAALAYGLPMRWKDRNLFQFADAERTAGAVRTIEWRLVRVPDEPSDWQLFHMFADTQQMHDRSVERPELVKRLRKALREQQK